MLYAAAHGLEAQELKRFAAAVLIAASPLPAAAQQPAPPAAIAADPALRAQAEALVPLLSGTGDYARAFAPSFRQAVPPDRFAAITAQLRATLGVARRVERLQPESRWAAQVVVAFERGTATMRLAIDLAPPHAITGLLITGTELRADTAARLRADVTALPGTAAIGLYALDRPAPAPLLEIGGGDPAPLGSAFKLWVLAECARQVAAGERRWDDVVPIGPLSLPSGILHTWPADTPVTVQTLATLMIAISDNTATDTLIALLGRGRVDAMARRHGATLPVLTTREAFVLKADPALTQAWATATDKRALLDAQASRIAAAPLDPMMFSGGPIAIDDVEWFAAPRDMARLLADLRDAGPVVRGILGVNHGIDPVTAARFGYVGFKGGSEPGVIALDLLAQGKDGRWYAVVGSWHRADAPVEEARFVALVTRALNLAAR